MPDDDPPPFQLAEPPEKSSQPHLEGEPCAIFIIHGQMERRKNGVCGAALNLIYEGVIG